MTVIYGSKDLRMKYAVAKITCSINEIMPESFQGINNDIVSYTGQQFNSSALCLQVTEIFRINTYQQCEASCIVTTFVLAIVVEDLSVPTG